MSQAKLLSEDVLKAESFKHFKFRCKMTLKENNEINIKVFEYSFLANKIVEKAMCQMFEQYLEWFSNMISKFTESAED